MILKKQLELTNEQTSPLFRIMWVTKTGESARKHFDNNICAFHIGNGLILSVAHNLRKESQVIRSIEKSVYEKEIQPELNAAQTLLFNRCYPPVDKQQYRHANFSNQNDLNLAAETFRQIRFDSRFVTLAEKKISNPYLIIQFKNNSFYNNEKLTAHFSEDNYFAEPGINRHTYLLETELISAFYDADIALYKIVNTPQEITDHLPKIEVDSSVLQDDQPDYYCLQSSPSSEVGRLLNKAQIEGFLEHFGIFFDRIGGNYTMEGLRYLIKGYFRFGSSGAPYVYYDRQNELFRVNAIQSEASPIQLSIEHKQDGNFQYINAIASPLHLIKDELKKYQR